jgi:hypothetical protein
MQLHPQPQIAKIEVEMLRDFLGEMPLKNREREQD